jgi:hypothetical protein
MNNYTEKNLSTLVEEIYQTVSDLNSGDKDIPEEHLETLTAGIKKSISDWAGPKNKNGFSIRMSNIGKPTRQLYYNKKYPSNSIPDAPTLIKFLYGHILEEVLLFLVKLSGNDVTDQQKEVTVNGVTGHLDCKINGEVVDVKTASNFAFRKFKNGTLREDDPFGYMSQLAGYEHAEGTSHGGFLVINKESGELTLYQPEELDKPNIETLINKIFNIFKLDTLPEKCYQPIPAGTKGNMKLPIGCVYCSHKIECHSDTNDGKGLRLFKYAKGIEYLTQVNQLPRVEEIITNGESFLSK